MEPVAVNKPVLAKPAPSFNPMRWSAATWQRVRQGIFWAVWLPGLWLVYLTFTDGLGANPAEKIIRETGTWTLIFLCASLSITPLRTVTRWTHMAPLRRTLGLTAFTYACIHLLSYTGWDQAFVVMDIVNDVIKRPFIAFGMAGFTVFLVLAITSPRRVVKAMGGVRWKNLHKAVYLLAVLAIVHFWWHKAGKHDFERPIAYGAVILAGFGYRIFHAWKNARHPSRPVS